MGSVCPSDRSDYLKAAGASIYINASGEGGRARGFEVGDEKPHWGPAPGGIRASMLALEKR